MLESITNEIKQRIIESDQVKSAVNAEKQRLEMVR